MKVEIENLKGITRLEFDIPRTGVWLLTGINGSGKTSLLAALYRIKNSLAFRAYYKTTTTQSRLDTFSDAKIKYTINQSSVTYSYGGKRWPPTPRNGSQLLNDFPYPNIQFVEANASRIEAYPEEIIPRRVNHANDSIKDFLSYILQDEKWNNLRYVNTRRGVGSDAYLIPYRAGRETHYFSEKNFSLGELCVLKLAKQITQVPDRSMILIDEIEMALHPQAQVRLLNRLQELTTQKQLTVIFSTHSSTLIKNINRKQILFLSKGEDDGYKIQDNVFPAQVLGEIAYDEEINSDFIFFVEDEEAKLLLEQLCGKYEEIVTGYKPMYKIVPIGGYPQVLAILDRSAQIFPDYVKRFAFLDDDVRTESIPNARRRNLQDFLNLYQRVQRKVNFLPCTPELGVVTEIERCNTQANRNLININFHGTNVRIDRHLLSTQYTSITADRPREQAKSKLDSIMEYIESRCGIDQISAKRILYRFYCDQIYSSQPGNLRALLGPIFNSR